MARTQAEILAARANPESQAYRQQDRERRAAARTDRRERDYARDSSRNTGIEVQDGETFCTITLEGEPLITQAIWDAIMSVAPPRLKIGRSTRLTESRTPGLIGVRYLSLVYHESDLP